MAAGENRYRLTAKHYADLGVILLNRRRKNCRVTCPILNRSGGGMKRVEAERRQGERMEGEKGLKNAVRM